MTEFMITTEDNPYDPFTQFDEWNALDKQLGYNTLSLIARLCYSSPELSETRQKEIYYETLEDILSLNLTGNYKRFERKNV